MPSRFLTFVIVIFWIGTSVWLFQRDLSPRLWPGGPPPFTIDLTEEAQANAMARWTLFHNGVQKGYSQTSVRHRARDDTFELRGEFKLWSSGRQEGTADQIIQSMYRVSREGLLREIRAEAYLRQELSLNLLGLRRQLRFQVEARLEGKVHDRWFKPHVRIKARNLDEPAEDLDFQQDLEPVRVSAQGSVLNPLQPLNRLPNLRPGQSWEMPVVNPLLEIVQELVRAWGGAPLAEVLKDKANVRVLHAEVLAQPQLLRWGTDDEEVPCLVIEYRGEDTRARTWVRQRDGLILQQEIKDREQHMLLVRD